jgi:hypothetical protein
MVAFRQGVWCYGTAKKGDLWLVLTTWNPLPVGPRGSNRREIVEYTQLAALRVCVW